MVETCQNVSNGVGDTSLGGSGGTINLIGVRIIATNPVLGQNMTSVKFNLKKHVGSPAGNGYAYVYNMGVLKATSTDFKDWSTLTGSFEDVSWTFAGHTIAENDDIVVGNCTNCSAGAEILFHASTPADYTDTYMVYRDGVTWTYKTTRNTQYCVTATAGGATTLFPPPPAYVRL